MKITSIQTGIVLLPNDEPLAGFSENPNAKNPIVTLKIRTDDGIEGLGVTYFGGALTRTLRRAVDELGALAIGEDPLRAEAVAAKLRAAAGGSGPAGIFTMALSAIDVALWDIKGKALGLPLWQLLGGGRDRVATYASGALRRGLKLEEAVTAAGRLREKGHRQTKMQLGLPGVTSPAREVEQARLIREAVGPDMDLMCDINQRWRVEQAIDIGKRVEDAGVGLYWLEDVTAHAGVAGGGWSTSAAWVDLDQDGRLDLVVARYLKWDFEPDLWCGSRQEGQRSYCHPDRFQPVTYLVYRNRGDGTFEDVTAKAGWSRSAGKGLGIAIGDYDRDGRVDIAVANDSAPQQLFHNLGGGRFEEVGLAAGMAYDEDGRTFAGMGIDFADYDNDGWPDLFVNALSLQRYALYRNRKGTFEYASGESQIGAITRLNSGWGAHFLDYDNDGWKDLFVAQGHVMDNISVTQPSLQYREAPLVMRNVAGKFSRIASGIDTPLAARGAAFGDLDNDGWIDVVLNCNDGPPVILRNRGGSGNHWLTVVTTGTRSNRDGIGAQLRVVTEDGVEQHAMVSSAGSYLSANDRRAHFGLGSHRTAALVEIVWPSGVKQTMRNVQADQILQIVER